MAATPISWLMAAIVWIGMACPYPAHAAKVAPAKGVFLIATENLDGTSFERTVILLTHFDGTGAMGIAINRKSGYSVTQFFEGLGSAPLFLGGPVRPEALFVLARSPEVPRRTHIFDDVFLISGPDAHRYLALSTKKDTANERRAIAGYSGWAPGQLESEIRRGDWETLAGEASLVLQKETDPLWATLLQLARARWI